jgi:hypothetical protein
VEKFVDFEIPEDILQEAGVPFTSDTKRKILGLNAATLYDLDVPKNSRLQSGEYAHLGSTS